MLYLLTSPHRNIIGCYFLPEPYACFDLGWLPERFKKALDELLCVERVKYDEQYHIILIPNYLKFNPLENPNQVKSAIEKVNELPQTALFVDLISVLKAIDKPFVKPLLQRLQERLPQPVTVTVYSSSNSNSNIDGIRARGEVPPVDNVDSVDNFYKRTDETDDLYPLGNGGEETPSPAQESSSVESSSPEFMEFWNAYPRKAGMVTRFPIRN